MKKLLSGVIISALVITAGTVSAFAYHGTQNQIYKFNKITNYVDLNNDGICDNKYNCGKGLYFIDANGDGICDNLDSCPKDGTGRQLGKHR